MNDDVLSRIIHAEAIRMALGAFKAEFPEQFSREWLEGIHTENRETERAPLSRPLVLLKRILVIAILLLAIVYGGDHISVCFRLAKNRDPYGVVRIRRYYAVTMKNGKPEFFFDQPTDQTCLHSLFPYFGYPPCWYLKRRATQQVKM